METVEVKIQLKKLEKYLLGSSPYPNLIKVGVTGLSQSGKSTFITSLVKQLEHHAKTSLHGFAPIRDERLLGVKVHPLANKAIPEFPVETSYYSMANGDEPKWPESTTDLSGCVLELKLKKKIFKGKDKSVFIEICDYPGEWLLDIPMLKMDFTRWSAQCSTLFNQDPRKTLLGDLLSELQQIDPLEACDEEKLQQMVERFKQFLHDCKYKNNSLSLIQPGHFLVPGEVENPESLLFIPLLSCSQYSDEQLKKADKNSYFKVCRKRYKQYQSELVEPFYFDFFSKIERQIVLVDIINALNGGPEYMKDMQRAITHILDCFDYGRNGVFRRRSPWKKVDTVVFAATKIDQVLPDNYEAVRQLLSVIVGKATRDAHTDRVKTECEVMAAVRSSVYTEHEGKQILKGHTLDGQKTGYRHPPIPDKLPHGDVEWQPFLDWDLPRLRPPLGYVASREDVFPHIRLDVILDRLIGDRCD